MIAQSVAAFPKTRRAFRVAYLAHMLHRPLSAGFIEPCLPTKTDKLPSGDLWLHEIKHDGFRFAPKPSTLTDPLQSDILQCAPGP
jgi:ATP-dependent DNA ligase